MTCIFPFSLSEDIKVSLLTPTHNSIKMAKPELSSSDSDDRDERENEQVRQLTETSHKTSGGPAPEPRKKNPKPKKAKRKRADHTQRQRRWLNARDRFVEEAEDEVFTYELNEENGKKFMLMFSVGSN